MNGTCGAILLFLMCLFNATQHQTLQHCVLCQQETESTKSTFLHFNFMSFQCIFKGTIQLVQLPTKRVYWDTCPLANGRSRSNWLVACQITFFSKLALSFAKVLLLQDTSHLLVQLEGVLTHSPFHFRSNFFHKTQSKNSALQCCEAVLQHYWTDFCKGV